MLEVACKGMADSMKLEIEVATFGHQNLALFKSTVLHGFAILLHLVSMDMLSWKTG